VRGPRIAARCVHCGLDAGPAPQLSASGQVFCCRGCETVYALLASAGLGAFYETGGLGSLAPRTGRIPRTDRDAPLPPALAALEAGGAADLDVVGMRCASCCWLIERYLAGKPGVSEVRVSYATSTAALRWDPARTSLRELLRHLGRIGYRARPADPRLRARQAEREERLLVARTGIAVLLAMNVMLASLGLYAGDVNGISAAARVALRWIAAGLATPVVVWAGWPFFRGAALALPARRATMDTLVALGAGAAFAASLVGLATGGHVYFDTAATIVALVLVGRAIEQRARRQGMQAIRSLLALEPETARLQGPDGETSVAAADLEPGDEVSVRPGERFPCDGTVLEGDSESDESLLTGESRPRQLSPGAAVPGGALNGWGSLRVRADRVGADAAVARIAAAVERALASRAPAERLADRVTGVLVPAVIVLAIVTGAAWWLWAGDAGRALTTGVAVVVIACPCALGLATPAALMTALGAAARRGIFFRDAAALERAADVGVVAFDKTGTLTEGGFRVQGFRKGSGWTENQLLAIAASAERPSEHALGRAIVAEARARGLATREPERFRNVPGGGVEAVVEGRGVLVGSEAFLRARGVVVPEDPSSDDCTLAVVAVDGLFAGFVEAGDVVRPEAADAAARLGEMGIRCAVVSGDRPGSVARAAAEAGLPFASALAGLSPEGKAGLLAAWRTAGESVAMVGDGVNDAPALAAADLGIALGTATDVALETADVALAGDDLLAVPTALALARHARRIVRQNLAWALLYNAAAVPLAMAGVIHPAVAALAMACSSTSVLVNALRAGAPTAPPLGSRP
jgi:Cu2+-exporting ATPase